jgi:uncharacterized protein YecT (DUF1311 family)
MRTFVSAMGLALLCCQAHASPDPHLSPSYNTCMKKAVSTLDLMACIQTEYDLQDRRLNDNYKALMSRLEDDRKKQLQETQRLWLKYVEANCGFYNNPNGGSAHRVMAADCLVQERARRATELADLAKME